MPSEGKIYGCCSSMFLSIPKKLKIYFGKCRLLIVNGENTDVSIGIHRKLVSNRIIFKDLRDVYDRGDGFIQNIDIRSNSAKRWE